MGKKERQSDQAQTLERELEQTWRQLQQARAAFELVSDPDLIDAWIYQARALQARYSYLMKRRRSLEEEEAAT